MFTDDNPDKGTETHANLSSHSCVDVLCLQMITPIRGRKLDDKAFLTNIISFTDDKPDKGTETV